MRRGGLMAGGVFVLAACASNTTSPAGDAATDLNAIDFGFAVSELGALPYLPWKYTPDGCYARALYYSMTLAEAGIPTKHLYVDTKPDGPPLFKLWGWHVAPVATKDGQNQLYVFDPALSPNKVVTVEAWIAIQGYADPTAADYPDVSIADGTSYNTDVGDTPVTDVVHPSAALYGEPTFAAMPKFTIGSVNAACDVMHAYIDLEPGSTAATQLEKHQALRDATVRLVGSLEAADKIDGTVDQIDPSCITPAELDTSTCGPDDPTVEPARPACCLASAHWCWSDTANNGAGACIAEGTELDGAVCAANQWRAISKK